MFNAVEARIIPSATRVLLISFIICCERTDTPMLPELLLVILVEFGISLGDLIKNCGAHGGPVNSLVIHDGTIWSSMYCCHAQPPLSLPPASP